VASPSSINDDKPLSPLTQGGRTAPRRREEPDVRHYLDRLRRSTVPIRLFKIEFLDSMNQRTTKRALEWILAAGIGAAAATFLKKRRRKLRWRRVQEFLSGQSGTMIGLSDDLLHPRHADELSCIHKRIVLAPAGRAGSGLVEVWLTLLLRTSFLMNSGGAGHRTAIGPLSMAT
jgi:hypothetical protein